MAAFPGADMRRWKWWLLAAVVLVGIVAALFVGSGSDGERASGAAGAAAAQGVETGSAAELSRKAPLWESEVRKRGELSLTGRVIDSDGRAVAGAAVTATARHGDDVLSDLQCQCDNACGNPLLECGCPESARQLVELVSSRVGEAPPVARATSDAEGKFELTGLDDKEIALWADSPGFVGFEPTARAGASVDILLKPARTVNGKVVDRDAHAVPNALVTAIYALQSRFFDATTNADGTFTFNGLPPKGTVVVVAMKEGLLPDEDRVRDARSRELTLTLHQPRALSGKVMRAGQPVAGADILLDGMHKRVRSKSANDGAFKFEKLRPGEYDLLVRSGNEVGTAKLTVEPDKDLSDAVIELKAGAKVVVLATDDRGAPLSGVHIVLESGGEKLKADTGTDGSAAFDGAPDGEASATGKAQGFMSASEELVIKPPSVQVTLKLRTAVAVSGTVVDSSGAPISAGSVTAKRSRSSAVELDDDDDDDDEGAGSYDSARVVDGGFVLEELQPGPYEVTANAEGWAARTQTVSAPARDVRFVLSEGASIEGVVQESDGTPVRNARVTAQLGKGGFAAESETDAKGRFVLKGIGAGSAKVQAMVAADDEPWMRGRNERASIDVMRSVSADVTVPATGVVHPTLSFLPAANISGIVVDAADGKPIAGARVWMQNPEEGEDTFPGMVVTGADGVFTFKKVPVGAMSLTARSPVHDVSEKISVKAGDLDVRIRLKQAASFVGRLADEAGAPIPKFTVNGRSVEAADGRFSAAADTRTDGGVTQLGFIAEGYSPLAVEAVHREYVTDLGVVTLQKGREVRGTVVTEAGSPVAGALVDFDTRAETPAHFYLSKSSGAVATDAQGRFTLPHVDSRATRLLARKEGFVESARPLSADDRDVQLVLHAGATLDVHLTGIPAGARGFVIAKGPSEAAASGMVKNSRVQLAGLAAGEWTLSTEFSEVRFRPLTVTLADADQKQVEWAAATDGVDVRYVVPGSGQAALFPGAAHSTGFELFRELGGVMPIQGKNGVFARVLPGQYTFVVFDRSADMKFASQIVTVTEAEGQTLQLDPATVFVLIPRPTH